MPLYPLPVPCCSYGGGRLRAHHWDCRGSCCPSDSDRRHHLLLEKVCCRLLIPYSQTFVQSPFHSHTCVQLPVPFTDICATTSSIHRHVCNHHSIHIHVYNYQFHSHTFVQLPVPFTYMCTTTSSIHIHLYNYQFHSHTCVQLPVPFTYICGTINSIYRDLCNQ